MVPGDIDLDRLGLLHPDVSYLEGWRLDRPSLRECRRPRDLIRVENVILGDGLDFMDEALLLLLQA